MMGAAVRYTGRTVALAAALLAQAAPALAAPRLDGLFGDHALVQRDQPLTVSGGVYENHHGLLGEEWATPNGATSRAYSGFKLDINYLDYSNAGLGYVPALSGGNALDPWQVIDISSGGTS